MSKLDLSGLSYYNEKIKEKLNEKVNVDDVIGIANGGTGANSEFNARANLKTNLITYTSFAQLGLPATATFAEITSAMSSNSTLQAPVYSPSDVPNLEIPTELFGFLTIEKNSGSPATLWKFAVSNSNFRTRQEWIGGYRGFAENEGWSGWIQTYPQVITGFYTGDGSNERIINLGVTPKAVISSKLGERFATEGNTVSEGAMAVTGSVAGLIGDPSMEIVENGFKVYTEALKHDLNSLNVRYNYTAWL